MPNTHIIRRQFLDVALAGSEADALALERRLPALCQDRLMPALEAVLDRVVADDEHWTLESLEIDAGACDLEALERGLVDQVSQAMERQLRERAARAGRRIARGRPAARAADLERELGLDAATADSPPEWRSEAQAAQDAFVHFLWTGLLPWWFALPSGQTIEDAVRASLRVPDHAQAGFGRKMAAALSSPAARMRLARQFSADLLAPLLARISADRLPVVREILAKIEKQGSAAETNHLFRMAVWQAAFAPVAAGERPSASVLVAAALAEASASGAWPLAPAMLERIVRLWPEVRVTEDAARPTAASDAVSMRAVQSAPESRVDLDEGVFIGCAGIVLLHPFLPRLFEALEIAAEDKLVRPDRALGVLHFLATGQPVAPEYELLLPKLLCNGPLEQPAPAPAALSAVEMEEANALLSAVIGHWTALGDSSIDGLRGSFLARPGKLSRRGDGADLLQVEPRSYDILLDRLPWGIGTIQLPWMERILWVEWRM